MVGSHLSVTVHGATNLSQSIGNPVVQLSLEGQVFTTKSASAKEHPQWNENFTFNITNGRDSLEITAISTDGTNERFLGRVNIHLTDLAD